LPLATAEGGGLVPTVFPDPESPMISVQPMKPLQLDIVCKSLSKTGFWLGQRSLQESRRYQQGRNLSDQIFGAAN
jgi:hypothetical protein